MRERCLVLFTKPARAGRVKTRLMPELTAHQAAELHQAFLDDLLPRLRGGRFDLQIAWALDDARDREPALAGDPVPSFRQHGADLGERLWRGLRRVARRYPLVAAIGSDHPEIGTERIEQAFEALEEGARVVIGPAVDGGYYLLGAEREALDEGLFRDVPWSAPEVFSVTVERCREIGIEPQILPAGHDVDSPDDLERLSRRIATGGAPCPHVETLLRSWGRLA